MTLSKDSLSKNFNDSLLLLMDNLNGQSFLGIFIDDWQIDDRIFPTTWKALKDNYYVRQTSNVTRYYTLSGRGWIEGLKLQGQFGTDEMKQKTGKLSATLKAKIKAVGRQYEQVAHVSEIAAESGLSEDFIRDAIESNLIGELFGERGGAWLDRGSFIQIPIDFGHPL